MKKKKPNVIDVIIVLILLAVVATAVFRALKVNELPGTVKNREIVYTVQIYDIDRAYVNSLVSGDSVYLSKKNLFCGTVDDIRSQYSTKIINSDSASLEKHVFPEKINISVDIKISADIAEYGFYIGSNTYLSIGDTLDFYTPTFSFNAQITDISTEEP